MYPHSDLSHFHFFNVLISGQAKKAQSAIQAGEISY